MTFAALWMDLEIVIFSRAEKDKYMIYLIRRILKVVRVKYFTKKNFICRK